MILKEVPLIKRIEKDYNKLKKVGNLFKIN